MFNPIRPVSSNTKVRRYPFQHGTNDPRIPFRDRCAANRHHRKCDAHRTAEISTIVSPFMRTDLTIDNILFNLHMAEHKQRKIKQNREQNGGGDILKMNPKRRRNTQIRC